MLKKSPSTGSEGTTLVVVRFYGVDSLTDEAKRIFQLMQKKALELTGPYDIKIWKNGMIYVEVYIGVSGQN